MLYIFCIRQCNLLSELRAQAAGFASLQQVLENKMQAIMFEVTNVIYCMPVHFTFIFILLLLKFDLI